MKVILWLLLCLIWGTTWFFIKIEYVRTYGDFILRIAYHESVHAGQLLGYLRQLNAPRPNIWD